MRGLQDIEAFLLTSKRPFETVTPGTYIVRSGLDGAIALRVDPPIVLLRLDVGQLPPNMTADNERAMFRTLLERNANALFHTSFGLEGGRVIVTAALELENLDSNEIEAVLDEMDLLLAQDIPALRQTLQTKA